MSMTPETPTPETNAAVIDGYTFCQEDMRPAIAFCANLERERDAARAEIEAMREAIREAHDVFVNLSEYWNKDQNENAMADACWHTVETSYDALTKLEPFIKL